MAFILTRPIAEQKQEFLLQIDELAGEKRLQYITDGAGQEVTYTAKLADAQAYILAGYPADVTSYHWIDAEATATNNTPTNVADFIVYTAHAWAEVGSKIEGARQAAKIGVNNATTVSAIRAIMESYKTALLAI